jgi:methyl-accepting chemotaxis protein
MSAAAAHRLRVVEQSRPPAPLSPVPLARPRARTVSVTRRLNLLLVLVITSLLSLSAGSEYLRARSQRLEDVNRQVTAALERGAKSLPSAVWNFDQPQVEQIIAAEMNAPFVSGIDVVNGGKTLAAISRDAAGRLQQKVPDQAAEQVRSIALNYLDNGRQVDAGTFSIHVTLDGMRQALLADLKWTLARALVLIVVLAACVSLALSRLIFAPMGVVRGAINNVAQGEADLTQRLPPSHYTEFNGVTQGFNGFSERLHTVVQQVRASAETVANGSGEIAQGIQDLSSRTELQSDSLRKVVGSIADLSQTVQHSAASAAQASKMAGSTESLVVQGDAVMAEVDSGMIAINDRSRQIVSIINVIDSIAFQTNILALNAAVESARAGEQGRGFAVVAAEVRALAQRSTVAAKEIKVLINDSVAMTDATSRHVARAGETMHQIVTAAKGVATTIAEISRVADHQAAKLKDIGRSIDSIEQTTQSNSAMVEEGSAAALSLRDQAQALLRITETFKLRQVV